MLHTGAEMLAELREAPLAVRRQALDLATLRDLAARCRRHPPDVVVTCARGSSAHAASFGKHLIERHIGVPVAAAAPNIATVYRRPLKLKNQLVLVISQSGQSDDLREFALMSKSEGAITVAVVNDTGSPLAADCDLVLPIEAGPERSIAATKSFIASLSILLRLAAEWAGSRTMRSAMDRLPDRLAEAAELDWSTALETLAGAKNIATLGRGPTLSIAREAALKLKETCHVHAEAFSGAEFQHGPVTLVSPEYPVVMFAPSDAAARGLTVLAADLRAKGAPLFWTGLGDPADGHLPTLVPEQPEADAVCLIQSFYALTIQIAARRGTDVDRPRHLQKVTRTR